MSNPTHPPITVQHLAETDPSSLSPYEMKQLKSALIVTAGSTEAHFMACVMEKLCSFVRPPIVTPQHDYPIKANPTSSAKMWSTSIDNKSDFIFKKVDIISELDFVQYSPQTICSTLLREYDLLVFTLYVGNHILSWTTELINGINRMIDRCELACLFLRGSGPSVAMKLGFIESRNEEGFVDYTDGANVQLLLENINRLPNKSLTKFLDRNKEHIRPIVMDNVNLDNCLTLGDSYICGLKVYYLKEKEWHFLAQGVNERDKFPWTIHKTKKVMFTPWYGFSHGNKIQSDLTFYSLRYLLFEHLERLNHDDDFSLNLRRKSQNNQLSDLKIHTIYSTTNE